MKTFRNLSQLTLLLVFSFAVVVSGSSAKINDRKGQPQDARNAFEASNKQDSGASSVVVSPTLLPTPKSHTFSTELLRQKNISNSPPPGKSSPIPVTASPSPKDFLIGRRFWISSEGYMARLLKREKDFLDATETIQNFTVYVERSIAKFLNKSSEPPSDQPLKPCNSDGEGFSKSMWNWFEQRRLPLMLENPCITELSGTVAFANESEDGDYTYSRRELLDAFRAREDALIRNRYHISDIIMNNWTEPDVRRAYLYNTSTEQCSIYNEGGVKVANRWYLFTSILNKPMDEYLPLFERQSITEMLHVAENGSVIPLHYSAQRRPEPEDKNKTHVWIDDTTTMLFSGQGGTSLGRFQNPYPEEIPSLISAMEESDLWIQQAQDALTPSSLAILILPVFLNLIPIALLAQVKTYVMLIYTVMSDVVTVIPMGIKGWELINISDDRHIASTLRVTSFSNGTIPDVAAMQIWVAECKVSDNVRTVGIAFLTVAVVSLVVGVTLEFVAKVYMTRRRLRRRMFQLENEPLLAGSTSGDVDMDAPIGAVNAARGNSENGYHKRRRSSSSGSAPRPGVDDYNE